MTQYRVGQTVEITHAGWEDEGEPWGKGSRLTLTRRGTGNGWWYGTARTGEEGLFREQEIAPLSEGPVRTETVTKRRIVPGVYGRLWVGDAREVGDYNKADVPTERVVEIAIVPWRPGYGLHFYDLNATELDDLALVASQLAEALRDV